MADEQSYNLKYTGKEIDDLLDKANDMSKSAQVPTGGTSGQVLAKKSSTNYDMQWVNQTGGGTEHGIPSGGSSGQALVKNSSTDYDVKWANVSGGSGGSGDVFVVTVSGTSSYTLSATFDEAYEKALAGVPVILIFTDVLASNSDSNPSVFLLSHKTYTDWSTLNNTKRTVLGFYPTSLSAYQSYNANAIMQYYVQWVKILNTSTSVTSYTFGRYSSTYRCLPYGGTTGQVLQKKSDTSYDVQWVDVSAATSSVSTSVIVDSGSQLPGSSSRTYTFNALKNGDRVIVLLQRESGRYTTNEYTWYGAADTKLLVCHPNDNQGCTIFNRAYLESTQITLAQVAWWSGYEYTGALSSTLVTGYKVIVARYS